MPKPPAKNDKLAVIEPAGKLSEVPEYLRKQNGDQRLGNENVEHGDVTVPRLSLCQSMSPQRKESSPKYIDGLREGMFFNNVTGQIYGKELRVIPVHYYKSRILWNGDRGELGKGMKCSSRDAVTGTGDPGGSCAGCPESAFGANCSLFMNFPILVVDKNNTVDLAGIMIFSMKSLSLATGKHWNTLVNIRNQDRFAGVYKITSVEDHRESGDSFQPRVDNDGWATQAQYETCKIAYHMINGWQKEKRIPQAEEVAEEV